MFFCNRNFAIFAIHFTTLVKGDIWTMLRDANPREYDKIAFQNGVKDHRGMLKRLTNVKKLNKRGGKSFVIRLPDTQEGITLIIYLYKII